MIRDYFRLQKLKRQRRQFEKQHRLTLDETEYMGLLDIDKWGEGERELIADKFWPTTARYKL